ncbi:MAG: class I SAM-dependent methyltransferase [Planctomycetota bacterium]|jgi:SAM-dependent methyltransferase
MKEQLPQGLVKTSDYKALLQSELFSRMEKFSNNFIGLNGDTLSPYGRKWVLDPLHQWSRQWEYPFVFSQIQEHAMHRPGPKRILDAGSGITFFPYFLQRSIDHASVTCCDTDATLSQIFTSVNQRTGSNIDFLCRDINNTELQSGSFDAIYCISVLEHTRNYDQIIKEFIRLLKDDGIIVVTFDISLDGCSDIPLSDLRKLVTSLQNLLAPTDQNSINCLLDEPNLFAGDIVTTAFVSDWNKSLLPWKYPLLSAVLASIKKRKLPRSAVKSLTFTCHTFGPR